MLNLSGKVAIITGGTRGIGFEIVKCFLENNATVILFGSKKETVSNAIEKLENKAEGYYPNLSDYDSVSKVIEEIYDKYGHIDILVNNAGISANKKIEDTTSEDFSNIINLNVNGMFNVTKAVVPYMKKNKQIFSYM